LRPLLAAAAAVLLVLAGDDGDESSLEGDDGNLIGDSDGGNSTGDRWGSDGDADAVAVVGVDDNTVFDNGCFVIVDSGDGDGDNGDDSVGERDDGRLRTLATFSSGDGADERLGVSIGSGGCEVVGSIPADGIFGVGVGGDMLFDAVLTLFNAIPPSPPPPSLL
jgi:hypothetical protein